MTQNPFITGLVSLIALSSCTTQKPPTSHYGPHHTAYGSGFAYPESRVDNTTFDSGVAPPQDNFNGTTQNAQPQNPDQTVSPYGTQQTPPTRTTPPAGNYPVAERTANPNEVVSPYEPYERIDISGYKSGQLVRHPTSKKIFRVP
jgi:hypothetical protein